MSKSLIPPVLSQDKDLIMANSRRSERGFVVGLALALFLLACGEPEPSRLPSVRRCALELRYEPPYFPSELRVEIEGQSHPLSLLDMEQGNAGLWGVDLWLASGMVPYHFLMDGRSLRDPSQALSLSDKGLERSLARIPNCAQGRWFRVSTSGQGTDLSFLLAFERGLSPQQIKSAQSGEPPQGVPLDVNSVRVFVDGSPHPAHIEGETLTVSSEGLSRGKHRLKIISSDQEGVNAEHFEAPFWLEDRAHRWERGVMYQVVLDRLSPPQREGAQAIDVDTPSIGARWGGQIDGVTEMIESGYFERLGVTSLWLSPLAPNPQGLWAGVEGGTPRYEGYHGYWATAPREVGEEWGGASALERLVSTAHEHQLRVIVDVALNHVHESHPYVSEHPDWFYPPGCLCGRPGCDWGSYIESCRFTPYLPDVRWEGLESMKTQVDDALWWLDRFDLDGLRVDAVPMMPRRVIKYLSAESRRRFEGLRTRHLLLGETFTGPQEWSRLSWYLGPDGLDGQFDFSWMWALREVLAWESEPLWRLTEFWRSGEALWSDAAAIMALFVDNHDVTRFVSEAAQSDLSNPWSDPPPQLDDPQALDQLFIAQALTYTLPGIPVLYYGDESGLAGANDPDNRRPYWPLGADAPLELSAERARHFQRIARLGRLRVCLDGLSQREQRVQFLASNEERLSFVRGRGDQRVVIVVQRHDLQSDDQLIMPLKASHQDGVWIDAMTGREVLTERFVNDIARQEMIRFHLNDLSAYRVMVIVPQSLYHSCQELIREPTLSAE